MFGAILATPFGGWIQSLFFGTGVRWQEAYTALGTAEASLPRNERERERLLTLNAMAEGEPPRAMTVGPRLHPPGTLAHLRYETFEHDGTPIAAWDVRALVPNIGNGIGPFWRSPCGPSCQEEIARAEGFRALRSGDAGISEEWVLRMPVGKPFELDPRPLRTHDILDASEFSMGLGSTKVGARSVPRPAKIRVTLIEACPAIVRVGTTMNVAWRRYSTMPIPQGLETSQWAQIDGCGKPAPLPRPQLPQPQAHLAANEPSPQAAIDKPPPAELRALSVRRETRTGHADLKVDEAWLSRHGAPVNFQVTKVCRYDTESDQWRALPPPDPSRTLRLLPLTPQEAAAGERVAYEAPRVPALFWVSWWERDDEAIPGRAQRYRREALLVSGPILCNDIALGPAPAGSIAACVPSADRAQARFVPEPAKAC